LIELFNKWERIICIGNVYSDEWKRNIDLIWERMIKNV
jgi:glutamine synthetase type III